MPKRGLSAYMFFANDQRDKVRDDNPGIKFGELRLLLRRRRFMLLMRFLPGEVGKLLGEKWKSLNEKQKAPYDAKAAADKKRYEEEKAAYQAVSCCRPALLSLSHHTDLLQGAEEEEEEE